MFVDEVEIEVAAGNGGNGQATFRKEKHVPRGGPNGGDGGKGGSVIFQVDLNLTTLLDYRYQSKHKAVRGGDGGSKDMFGKNGADLILKVPQGTTITDAETGELLADLSAPDGKVVIARGGIGGRGNAHFVTSVHQSPKFAERGEPGEVKTLKLELKLLADVGLLGFPNVGKSTLIASVSAAKPKIANYPFTTLIPNLGVVYVEDSRSFVMADIPGIIEGASEGIGLGHQFLRHVERTRLLIHVLDMSGMTGREPLEDYEILNRELALYSDMLAELPQFVALNKMDVADPELVAAIDAELTARGCKVYHISAATRQGLQPLIYDCMMKLEEIRAEDRKREQEEAQNSVHIVAKKEENERQWHVEVEEDGAYRVVGKGIERMVAMTDFTNEYGVRRLQRSLDKIGITKKLRETGIRDGETVRIRDIEFNFEDEDAWDEEREAEAQGLPRHATG